MNRLVVALALVAAACAGAAIRPLLVPPAHAAVAQRWEYFCFRGWDSTEDLTKRLNDAGREGWEAFMVTPSGSGPGHVCLKRPAP